MKYKSLRHKGYLGSIKIDEDAGILYGEVLGIRDMVTFQGKSVAELQKAFRDSVDDYLAFCQERGEEPNKPYSGKFVVRTKPGLHRRISLVAQSSGKSINQLINEALYAVFAKGEAKKKAESRIAKTQKALHALKPKPTAKSATGPVPRKSTKPRQKTK